MAKVTRARETRQWSKEELLELETMWKQGDPADNIAFHFGYSSGKTLRQAVTGLRKNKLADLPYRPSGRPCSPVGKAAVARGLETGEMVQVLVAILNEEGAIFIDNLLDDGVTTLDVTTPCVTALPVEVAK